MKTIEQLKQELVEYLDEIQSRITDEISQGAYMSRELHNALEGNDIDLNDFITITTDYSVVDELEEEE